MKQISGRMTGTEIQIEMEIQSLRKRIDALETALRQIPAQTALPDVPAPRPADVTPGQETA
jgi:hypothetical protein